MPLSDFVNVQTGRETTRYNGDALGTNNRIGKYTKPARYSVNAAAPGDDEPAVHVNPLFRMLRHSFENRISDRTREVSKLQCLCADVTLNRHAEMNKFL